MHGVVDIVDLVEASLALTTFEDLPGAHLLLLGLILIALPHVIFDHHWSTENDLVVGILWILVKHKLHRIHIRLLLGRRRQRYR